MKKIVKKIIPSKYHEYILSLKNKLLDVYATKSYSQEGEDIILSRIFENQKEGFYVDVGAHHPKRFSNTYFFYKRGWRGINIDPMPGSMRLFNRVRPRDINLECGIFGSESELLYFIFDDLALNTFSEDLADKYSKNGCILKQKILIKVFPLFKIFEEHIKDNQKIDFMSIDVEGLEMQVIKSNDWTKYRPTVVVIESLDFDLLKFQDSAVYNFLTAINYTIFAKTINTLFLKTEA